MYKAPGHTHGHPQSHTHGHPSTNTTVVVTTPPQPTTVVTHVQPPITPFNPLSYANNRNSFHYYTPQQHTTSHTHSHTHSYPPSGF